MSHVKAKLVLLLEYWSCTIDYGVIMFYYVKL